MSVEENKVLFRRIIEDFNNGNHDAPFDVMASNCVIQDERGVGFDKESYKKRMAELLAVFPDYHLVIEDLYAVEDKVIVELKSVEKVMPVHKKQLLTYLRLADKRLGLLINFGSELIRDGISRVVNGL